MSSLTFPSIITLLILSILPFSSTAFLVDLDNDPIQNGRNYYILPVSTGSSLTYAQKNNKCPLYITSENSYGTPVKISSPLRTLFISLGERVDLAFVGSTGTTPCKKSLVWKSTIDPLARKVYITTGGGSSVLNRPFSVTKRDRSLLPTYELKFCGSSEDESCSNVGLFENDGLLGLTQYATTISFKKAFKVDGEESSSQI